MCVKSAVIPEPIIEEISVGDEVLLSVYDIDNEANFADNTTYTWDFGDHTTPVAGGICATHVYTYPGEFVVTLTAGATVLTKNIEVLGSYRKLAPIYSSPLFELKLDNNLTDSSTNSRTVSCIKPSYAQGIENECLDTRDIDGYATVNGYFLNDLSSVTISLWYRALVVDTFGYLLHKRTSGGTTELSLRIGNDYIGARLNIGGTLRTAETYINQYNLNDTNWHHVAMVYDGSYLRLYIDRNEIEGSSTPPTAATGNLVIANTDLFIGKEATGTTWQGYIDELKIYNAALSLSEIFDRLDIWHADFQSRYSQYLYVQIPEAYRGYRLLLTLSGSGYSNTLIDKNSSLLAEEVATLNNYTLNAKNYTLTAAIYNGEILIDSISKKWNKLYSGIPKVGIDKNNGYRINGTKIFPVLPWIVDSGKMNNYTGMINAFFGLGFGNSWGSGITQSDWSQYLDACAAFGAPCIGPDRWTGRVDYPSARNSDPRVIESYVNNFKNNSAMLAWEWMDEPNLGDLSTCVPSTVIRAWTRLSHDGDQNHPVMINLGGKSHTRNETFDSDTYSFGIKFRRTYSYLYSWKEIGDRVPIVDSISLDYYPMEWGNPASDNGTVYRAMLAIKNMISDNYGLIPVWCFIETTDIYESPYPTKYFPTPAQIKMLAWCSIINGATGIAWFPYRYYMPDENEQILIDTKTLIDYFATVLLSDVSAYSANITLDVDGVAAWDSGISYIRGNEVIYNGVCYICITDNTNVIPGGGSADANAAYWKISRHVDLLIKEDDTNVYVFAGRMTEFDNIGQSSTLHVNETLIVDTANLENKIALSVGIDNLSTTITISPTISGTASVYGESRNIDVTNGVFTDEFNRNDIHIYIIPKA